MQYNTGSGRNITRPHYGKNLVYFPSRKNNSQMICESVLEADYCVHLEHDPAVTSYTCQPKTFKFQLDGRTAIYTPDFSVETRDASFYVEVKLDRENLIPSYRQKLSEAGHYIEARGRKLIFADTKSVYQGNFLYNLRTIYFRSFNVSPAEFSYLTSKAGYIRGPITLAELISAIPDISPQCIYLGIFTGLFHIDLQKPLTLASRLETAI